MKRALVIADDLTGAAEIAGIGHRFGLPTRLRLNPAPSFADGLTVIDSDTRLLERQSASDRVRELIDGIDPGQFDLIFKKIDSVMRGNICAEVLAMMDSFKFAGALLVPQNPSRGRTIVDGEYRINGTPLHETGFADDPDHPAKTSNAATLLGVSTEHPVSVTKPATELAPRGVALGCAADAQDVQHWASLVNRDVLPAGGADFFTAILESRSMHPVREFITYLVAGRDLFVCGSASGSRDVLISEARKNGFTLCLMPDEVFGSGDASHWQREVCEAVKTQMRSLIAIPQPLDRNPLTSRRLQRMLSDLVAMVLESTGIDNLFVEGGATACSICRRMNWSALDVVGELVTGVVAMIPRAAPKRQLIIKPGSYLWPDWVLADR